MAVYIHDRRRVLDTNREGGKTKEIITFFVDAESDIERLPLTPQIGETSVALVVDTGAVYTLMATGWREL